MTSTRQEFWPWFWDGTNASIKNMIMLKNILKVYSNTSCFITLVFERSSTLVFENVIVWSCASKLLYILYIRIMHYKSISLLKWLKFGYWFLLQYLDMRFKSKAVRCLASACYVIRSLMIVSVATFTPCIAMKTVIGVPYYVSIPGLSILSIICMFSVSEWKNILTLNFSNFLFLVKLLILIPSARFSCRVDSDQH